MSKFLCVVDFEATCDDNPGTIDPQEIIEFPSVLIRIDGDDLKARIIAEFQKYIRPAHNPTLTSFCKKLTGISQDQIDSGTSFEVALSAHRAWLTEQLGCHPSTENVTIVTCGDWDIKSMLPRQCFLTRMKVPEYLTRVCNIKIIAQELWGEKKRPSGMVKMLTRLRLPLIGREHSGIDDCRNIAAICLRFASMFCKFRPTGELMFKSDEDAYTFRKILL